jgi:hypothetical protein
MKQLSKLDFLGKVERLNLINSCTGYKSANLIATEYSWEIEYCHILVALPFR